MGNSQSGYTELIKESVIGYKAFSSDFSCRGFKYEVGQTYEMPAEQKIKLGHSGFHFCRFPYHCKKYYPYSYKATTRYAKVEAWDSIHTENNSVARKIRIIEELSVEQFRHLTGCFTTTNATIHLKNGKLHREDDLPAIEYVNGDKRYYVHGVRHRNGQPAVEKANGDYIYCVHGQCHNPTGPAIKSTRWWGIKYRWVLNGREYFPYYNNEYAEPDVIWIDGKPYKAKEINSDSDYNSD